MPEETDLDSMSLEELEQHINNISSENPDNDTENKHVQSDDNEQVEEEIETESSSHDNPQSFDEKPQYRNKSREDVIAMQENATKKISSQQNEIYEMKKQLEALKKEPLPEVSKSDKYKEYDQDQLRTVESIVEDKLTEQKLKIIREKEEEIAEGKADNEKTWAIFEKINPEISEKVLNAVVADAKANPDLTFNKKGWLQENLTKYVASVKSGNRTDNGITTRKLKAATVGSGNGVVNKSISNKSIDEMTADEFALHLEQTQGIRI